MTKTEIIWTRVVGKSWKGVKSAVSLFSFMLKLKTRMPTKCGTKWSEKKDNHLTLFGAKVVKKYTVLYRSLIIQQNIPT